MFDNLRGDFLTQYNNGIGHKPIQEYDELVWKKISILKTKQYCNIITINK